MVSECCVPLCKKKGGYSFPFSRPKVLKGWIIAVKRDKWQPTKYSVVCSAHFEDKDFVEKTIYGLTPKRKILKPEVVPHVFPWNKVLTPAAASRTYRMSKKRKLEATIENEREAACQNVAANEQILLEDTETTPETPAQQITVKADVTTISTQTNFSNGKSARDFMFNDARIHYFTGLESYKKFEFVLQTLGPAADDLNYHNGWIPSLSVEDQFFLTLIKLRRHTTNYELSQDFGISEAAVTNIFVTWINFMSVEWGDIDWWPSRDMVKFFSPSDFKVQYPSTRVIVDGTECPIKKPKQPLNQQATFSTYKNCNTVKVLVGSSPGGLISYVSNAYAGSTSDRAIAERSDLPNMCDSGDSVMADKGFNVQDLFIANNVTINIQCILHFISKKYLGHERHAISKIYHRYFVHV